MSQREKKKSRSKLRMERMEGLNAAFKAIEAERTPAESPSADNSLAAYERPVEADEYARMLPVLQAGMSLNILDGEERFKTAYPLYRMALTRGDLVFASMFAQVIYNTKNPPLGRKHWMEEAYRLSMDSAVTAGQSYLSYKYAAIHARNRYSIEEDRVVYGEWAGNAFDASKLGYEAAVEAGEDNMAKVNAAGAAYAAKDRFNGAGVEDRREWLLNSIEWEYRTGELRERVGERFDASLNYISMAQQLRAGFRFLSEGDLLVEAPVGGKPLGELVYDCGHRAVELGGADRRFKSDLSLSDLSVVAKIIADASDEKGRDRWLQAAVRDYLDSAGKAEGDVESRVYTPYTKAGIIVSGRLAELKHPARRPWLDLSVNLNERRFEFSRSNGNRELALKSSTLLIEALVELIKHTSGRDMMDYGRKLITACVETAKLSGEGGDVKFSGSRFRKAADVALKLAEKCAKEEKPGLLGEAVDYFERSARTTAGEYPTFAIKRYRQAAKVAGRLLEETSEEKWGDKREELLESAGRLA